MRFPVVSLILIGIAGIMLFLFVVFNFAYMGPGGLKEELRESANKTLTGDRLSSWNSNVDQMTQGFGIACVVCFLLGIVFFVIEVLDRPGEGY